MALTTETGAGLAGAESYLSVADADAYVAAYLTGTLATAWAAADADDKEVALRRATQYLDAEYGWLGDRYSVGQALDWPRYNVEVDGVYLTPTTLPTQLKNATAELAVRALADNTLIDDETTPGQIEEYEVQADTIKERTKYVGGRSQQTKYTLVDNMLRPLVGYGQLVRS